MFERTYQELQKNSENFKEVDKEELCKQYKKFVTEYMKSLMSEVTTGEKIVIQKVDGIRENIKEVSDNTQEANVAVSLANYGMNATFVSKVPEHEIGQCAINELRRYGVDTKFVARGGNRLGVYFCEKGASQRVSKVIYDRENSSISQADPEDFNWDLIFDKADWFHWTGITPALGGRLPEICKAACKAAKERQIPISCDLNFRKKLWTRERANAVMQQLMPYVDVCIANEEDAKNVFGIVSDGTDIDKAQINKNGYIDVARQLTRKFGFRKVAFTLRTSLSANDNDWMGMLYNGVKRQKNCCNIRQ